MANGKWKMENVKTRSSGLPVAYSIFHFPFSMFLLLLLLLLPGCTWVHALSSKVMGPEPVEAQYIPLPEPMLVLVENFRAASTTQLDAEMLTRYINTELTEHNIAPVIDFDKLAALRTDPTMNFREMKIDAIGRAVGAKQILYVDLVSTSVAAPIGGEVYVGRAAARVKIVDATTGETRWPSDITEGAPMSYQTPSIPAEKGGDDPMRVRQRLDEALAGRIGRLFYKWSPEDVKDSDLQD